MQRLKTKNPVKKYFIFYYKTLNSNKKRKIKK